MAPSICRGLVACLLPTSQNFYFVTKFMQFLSASGPAIPAPTTAIFVFFLFFLASGGFKSSRTRIALGVKNENQGANWQPFLELIYSIFVLLYLFCLLSQWDFSLTIQKLPLQMRTQACPLFQSTLTKRHWVSFLSSGSIQYFETVPGSAPAGEIWWR